MKKQKNWTLQQKQFVKENLNTLPFAEIAKHVGKSENAVRIMIHRHRLEYKSSVKHNIVIELLEHIFTNAEYFKPNREFYNSVGLTQMRFWRLYRGEASPTEKEWIALLSHFEVTKQELFEARQLSLFDIQE